MARVKPVPIGTRSTLRMGQYGYYLRRVKTERGWHWALEHRLIWEDAYGAIPKGCPIHHRNGIKTDNRLENLELCESQADHSKRHISQLRENGRRTGQANRGRTQTLEHRKHKAEARRRAYGFGPEQEREILRLRSQGTTLMDIAERVFGDRKKFSRVWKFLNSH